MARKPIGATERRAYDIPSQRELRKTGVAGAMMQQIIGLEELANRTHSEMVIHVTCKCYVASQEISADPQAFDAFMRDPKVKGLPRPPKTRDDVLRAMLQVTVHDPKLASKRFKRLEHLWENEKPVSDVATLLKRFGWEKPIPRVTKPRPRSVEDDDVVSDDDEANGGSAREAEGSKQRKPNGPSVTITLKGVPRHLKVKKGSELSLCGRVIKQVGDELTIADAEIDF